MKWDRVKASLFALVGRSQRPAAYLGLWRATVVAAPGKSMTVDVTLDDPSLPGMSALPLQVGIPAATVDFAAGARVLVGFENGDPAKAYAVAWGPGASATRVSLPAGKVELGAEDLAPTTGVVNGEAIDFASGLPQWMLGNASETVLAKG